MNKLKYNVAYGQSFNCMRLSDVEIKKYEIANTKFVHPINLEESYVQVIYPQRNEYIKQLTKVEYQKCDYKNLYLPFENEKIDFSTAFPTTHEVKVNGEFYIEVSEKGSYSIELSTCGRVVIFVNDKQQVDYAPFTRNIISKKNILIKLDEGVNKINLFTSELAERDVIYNFQLKNLSAINFKCFTYVDANPSELSEAIKILQDAYFNKDEYLEGEEVKLHYNNNKLQKDLTIQIEPMRPVVKDWKDVPSFTYESVFSPYESTTTVDDQNFPVGTYRLSLSTRVDNEYITRNILFSKYCDTPNGIKTVVGRKEFIKQNLAQNSADNITKALLLMGLGKDENEFISSLDNGLEFISTHGDCADFQTVPLLWIIQKYSNLLSEEKQNEIKTILLDFRYWMDEYGNDAMWWFSENHAFLFHISQYLAGAQYPNELFTRSGKKGREQYEIGKSRILHWFETFNKYQFAEWNSTTYFPVDFIGFIALYECAPDLEIKNMAKEALDLSFDIIQKNIHHKLMPSTYGRVYENELKGMRNGELAMITWLFFDRGYYNKTNRASIMFVLSDYEPKFLTEYDINSNKDVEVFYKQGFNEVGCYTYKSQDYMLSTVINYKYKQRGHQQHIMNVSFSIDEILMWINNPGEKVFSGDSRPSYWAGNSTNPQVFAKENVLIYNYDNTTSEVNYTHMYFPTYKFEKFEIKDNVALAENKGSYIGIVSTGSIALTDQGPVANRELKFDGLKGQVVVVLGSKETHDSLENFKASIDQITINSYNDSIHVLVDKIKYLITSNQFYIDNKLIDYNDIK